MKNKVQEAIPLSDEDKAMITKKRNFNILSEAVVQYTLEKIILNSAHLLYLGDLHEQIPHHCEESIFRIVNCATKLEFLQHDRDDLQTKSLQDDVKEENIEGNYEIVDNPSQGSRTLIKHRHVLYEDYVENINNWDSIKMPDENPIDREACSTIKVEKFGKKTFFYILLD